MNEKNIKARIVHKHDIESNWLLATNFTPKQGEIICYDIDENYTYERFKIGDGITNVNDLPFCIQQPDWNQIDSTKPDYIKNKPDENDALELVSEMGLVEPVLAEDGSVYTDENGVLYTL